MDFRNSPADTTDPRPTDPQFQFLMLLAARKAGNRLLESLARDWLAEGGIHVVFAEEPPPGKGGLGATQTPSLRRASRRDRARQRQSATATWRLD
jgi:hypothetical protein